MPARSLRTRKKRKAEDKNQSVMNQRIIESGITEINIDDYIRDKKRKGEDSIFWNNKNWEILKQFFLANAPCVHGMFCLCSEISEKWIKKHFKNGITFMGVKHYRL